MSSDSNESKSEIGARLINIAKRCQLVTGSFAGNDRACPCTKSIQCSLSEGERKVLAEEPTVKQIKQQNLNKFAADTLENLGFTEEEIRVAKELAKKKDIGIPRLMKIALAVQQSIDSGNSRLESTDPPVGCPVVE